MTLFSLFVPMYVIADVPSVIELELEVRGQETVLVATIRHNSPSSRHYVDVVDIELDGKVEKFEDLPPQTETTFVLEFAIDSSFDEIRLRAHCTNHGWSQWITLTSEEEQSPNRGIPGFPIAAVVIGILFGIILTRYIW